MNLAPHWRRHNQELTLDKPSPYVKREDPGRPLKQNIFMYFLRYLYNPPNSKCNSEQTAHFSLDLLFYLIMVLVLKNKQIFELLRIWVGSWYSGQLSGFSISARLLACHLQSIALGSIGTSLSVLGISDLINDASLWVWPSFQPEALNCTTYKIIIGCRFCNNTAII